MLAARQTSFTQRCVRLLDDRRAVRSRLAMRPMTRPGPEPGYPMNRSAAIRTVEDELAELALEVGLHVQELEPQHLRVDGQRMGPVEAGVKSLVDELVGLRRLLGQSPDGSLEDVAFTRGMAGIVRARPDHRAWVEAGRCGLVSSAA